MISLLQYIGFAALTAICIYAYIYFSRNKKGR